jgi:hypothetical protein
VPTKTKKFRQTEEPEKDLPILPEEKWNWISLFQYLLTFWERHAFDWTYQ